MLPVRNKFRYNPTDVELFVLFVDLHGRVKQSHRQAEVTINTQQGQSADRDFYNCSTFRMTLVFIIITQLIILCLYFS